MRRTVRELERARQFYAKSLQLLREHDIPFLIGGAYAMAFYTGIERDTKDLDLYLRPKDIDRILELFQRKNYRVERTHPHWLAKILQDNDLVDLIYRAGNGLCEVDESWFERGQNQVVLGSTARVAAPEELIWMKAYIMERERYDGGDVAHLFLSCADRIDWHHLLKRFGEDWRVLLTHIVLFGYVYPSERHRVPPDLVKTLSKKMQAEGMRPAAERVCRGTLLSRAQYLVDVEERGFRDARLDPRCKITPEEIESWTALIPPDSAPSIRSAK